jgi:hypothetical protein
MLLHYRIHCVTENLDKFWWLTPQDLPPTKCPTNTAHTVDPSSVVMMETTEPQPNPKTSDARDIIAVNRIPTGYTIYPTGRGDDIAGGHYGQGPKLKFDSGTTTAAFQMKDHHYAIGGRVLWQNATLDDEMNAFLYAPATSGLVSGAGGNCTKVPIGGGVNTIVPTPPGAGNWTINPAAKLNANVSILAATPVPSPTGTGYWDYDSNANILPPSTPGKGGYLLFDQDIPLFNFANAIFGNGSNEMSLDITDVVAKLLFNFWQIRFVFTPGPSSTAKVGVILILAVARNV